VYRIGHEFLYAALWDHPLFGYHPDFGWMVFNKFVYFPTQEKAAPTLDNNVIVVTGASSGIGLALVHQIEDVYGQYRGAENSQGRVVSAVRTVSKWHKVHNSTEITEGIGVPLKLDLASLKSVVEFANSLEAHVKDLSSSSGKDLKVVLVNNAGISFLPEATVTEDGFDMVFQSNHLGHYLLTRLLIQRGLLRRTLQISSTMHFQGTIASERDQVGRRTHARIYSDTKLMNNLFSMALAKRGVLSNAVHPGLVATDILRHRPLFKKLVASGVMSDTFRTTLSSEESATTLLWTVFELDGPKDTGKYYGHMREYWQLSSVYDEELQEFLWDVSQEYVTNFLTGS
jgi:retinol dehydrogenase-12